MRKLVVGTFLTLDGVMQAPGGPDEDRSGGFTHGGWAVPYFDDAMIQHMDDWISRLDALVLGRKTYEIFAAHWPHIGGGDPIANRLNHSRKYVASRTLKYGDWKHTTILRDDVPAAIAKLKSESGGELQVHGSGDLVQTLLRHRLIDELRLWTMPVVLGSGKRLFAGGAVPESFDLVETRTAATGAVLHVLRAAGDPRYGSFALENPTEAELTRRKRIEQN